MEMTAVPEINVADATKNPDAAAMALTGNTMQDLRSVAQELGVALDASGNVATQSAAPAQPTPAPTPAQAPAAQPSAAEQPKPEAAQPAPQVPAKFQNPDGTLNEQRLEKSSQSLDEAIARYRAKEREFHQLQNKVNNPAASVTAAVAPVAAAAQTGPQPLTQFEIQIAQDLLNEAAAVGEKMSQGHAIAQARVIARVADARYNAEMAATQDLRTRIEDNERARELQGMINGDPSLLSAEMVETLWGVRQANPYLNQAKEPWKAAYTFHLGQQQSRGGQVQTPTPTGTTAKAPPTPVGPVSRVQSMVDIGNPRSMSDEALTAEIKKLYPNFRG